MMRWVTLLRTLLALGLPSVARVALYRVGLRLGVHPVQRLRADAQHGAFFHDSPCAAGPVSAPPVLAWSEQALLFGHLRLAVGIQPPDWLANPLTGERVPHVGRAWWQIPDFDPRVGDIKLIWELSRMDWVLAMAQRARNGDTASTERLNDWLSDWCQNNPPYLGPNWKCGQEASIRVMHLAMGALILGQVRDPKPALAELIRLHLARIAPTMSYAIGQNNNHGTSEAAALFIGGSWLEALGDPRGTRWAASGRRWLGHRASQLIGESGSFSQYSLNYHRMMLDTFSMAEVWRRHLGLAEFAEHQSARLRAATQWLHRMVDPVTGLAPNLGANDGARLLQLTDGPYPDYRTCLQLASVLFEGRCAIAAEGPWDRALLWLGLSRPGQVGPPPASGVADDGGFALLRRGSAMVMLRYPRFAFRPSQADALHLDAWVDGENLLRDAGTYSYNTEPRVMGYFGGTAGHNTVQFDDRDQMPRLGRFLLGDWLRTDRQQALRETGEASSFAAGYRDSQGAGHLRSIRLSADGVRVVDEIDGFRTKAVLRWRLAPGSWHLQGHSVSDGRRSVAVHASMPIVRCALVEGWESRHYLDKQALVVLEVEVARPGTLTSDIRWAA